MSLGVINIAFRHCATIAFFHVYTKHENVFARTVAQLLHVCLRSQHKNATNTNVKKTLLFFDELI